MTHSPDIEKIAKIVNRAQHLRLALEHLDNFSARIEVKPTGLGSFTNGEAMFSRELRDQIQGMLPDLIYSAEDILRSELEDLEIHLQKMVQAVEGAA